MVLFYIPKVDSTIKGATHITLVEQPRPQVMTLETTYFLKCLLHTQEQHPRDYMYSLSIVQYRLQHQKIDFLHVKYALQFIAANMTMVNLQLVNEWVAL